MLANLLHFCKHAPNCCICSSLENKTNALLIENVAHRRVKRYPTCPCVGTIQLLTTDYFLYTNGRCYAQYLDAAGGGYANAQTMCQLDAGAGNVGRSATFDSVADYVAITGAMTGHTPGAGGNRAWIGVNNQKWDDPNSPSCPPPLNVTEFQTTLGMTIPNGTVGIGGGWNSWNPYSGTGLKDRVCEFGKNLAKIQQTEQMGFADGMRKESLTFAQKPVPMTLVS